MSDRSPASHALPRHSDGTDAQRQGYHPHPASRHCARRRRAILPAPPGPPRAPGLATRPALAPAPATGGLAAASLPGAPHEWRKRLCGHSPPLPARRSHLAASRTDSLRTPHRQSSQCNQNQHDSPHPPPTSVCAPLFVAERVNRLQARCPLCRVYTKEQPRRHRKSHRDEYRLQIDTIVCW